MPAWWSGITHLDCLWVLRCLPVFCRSDKDAAGDAQYADFSARWQRLLHVLPFLHWLSELMFVSVGSLGVLNIGAAAAAAVFLSFQWPKKNPEKSNWTHGLIHSLTVIVVRSGSVTALPETDTTPSAKRQVSELIRPEIQHKCLMKRFL